MFKISIKYLVFSIFGIIFLYIEHTTNYLIPTVHAIVDPLVVPNNKFGIHIIHATPDESSPAAQMVNTNGDWGYVTVLIESKDRDQDKWQEFFNDLRGRHLIPLVRLATKPVNEHWERPYEGEEQAWADFLDRLNWPTKNRYVVIYNEPNHGKEWGNFVDAKMYAKVLDQIITELKSKNRDYFVLNSGFDASAPSKPPLYEDQLIFMKQMEEAVPGIFSRLDGWVSHSYPNPAFAGSPYASGRGTVKTWYWELQQLRNLGVTKNLPVFITETGWQHAEGIDYNPSLPTAEIVAKYYQDAFMSAWSSERIVAVTPFLLDYQEKPFDHFSFKKFNGNGTENTYYPQYQILKDLPKVSGKPMQENRAQLIKGEIYSSMVSGESYQILLAFKNIGQSIWNDPAPVRAGQVVKLVPIEGGSQLGIVEVEIPKNIKIEPGQEYRFSLNLKAPESGSFKVVLNLFSGPRQFDSEPLEFTTEVKSPVMLQMKTNLKWKNSPEGDYLLSVEGVSGKTTMPVHIKADGQSDQIETKTLLPDYIFTFILEKPFYKPKIIQNKLLSGLNVLDFGILDPDIISAILRPGELWKLLPFSR